MPTLTMNKLIKSPSASSPSLMLLFLLFLFLWLFTSSQSTPLPSNVSHSDEHALLQFKAALTLYGNNSLDNWTANTSFCKWIGVTCSAPPMPIRVVRLNLSDMGLEGTISPLVGNLSALQSLDLSNNALTGHIPPQLGKLSIAKELILYRNQLEGNIPASLSRCSSLVELTLSYNQLQGSIPPELGFLPRLEILNLGVNHLKGRIPSSIGNLSLMIKLELSMNNLTGTIPDRIGMLTKLQNLHVGSNNLIGSIPISVLNCSKLVELSLHENQLSGHIPWELGNKLNNLQSLYLWGNMLIGKIPNSIGNCTNLKFLYLGNNLLYGMVPIEFGKFLFIERIDLQNNLLKSSNASLTFITALTNCSNLQMIDVSYNNLTGILPPSIGQMSPKLSELYLDTNKIGGYIPQEITNLTNITTLYLGKNLLSGYIPSGIGRFHKLERLSFSYNLLEGRIPEEIGQMQSLGLLSIRDNKLSGRIPASLGRLEQLRRIFLNNNHFSGDIPSSLAKCENIELLDLSHNHLNGSIPGEVMVSVKSLQFYLNLSSNFLQGPLPREMSKIESVQAIDISRNRLHGEIPGALANCIALVYLNLSHNIFHGPIPGELYKLKNLEDIDLSFNFLSGSVPMSFKQMRMLRYMNVSFNNLTGYVGEEFLPNNTIVVLFMGNPGLCGARKYLLPACPKEGQGKKLALRNKILVAVGVIAFILFFSILALIWRWKFSRQQPEISTLMFEKIGYPKFSYQDIVIATNGFTEESLLGAGNFGSVYKGTLEDGRLVAIKVLHMQDKEGERSFKTECKVLGRIRHRNVIRVISACFYLNFKALVLQFACNGSLEKLLYQERDEEDVCRLGLSECLNIAIDVAHGMEYLHHDCFTQVVHCDLKPSNVLLDADMTAIVSDFGISRFTNFADFMDSLGTSCAARGTIGYIAPEYGLGQNISTKGDVYSYGVLLLEMVTRKKPTDAMFVRDLNLPSWVRSAFPNRLVDVVDNQLLNNLTMEQHRCFISFIHVGLLCSHQSPHERPTMRDVGRALESLRSTFTGNATATSHLTTTIHDLLSIQCTSNAPVEATSDSQSSTY